MHWTKEHSLNADNAKIQMSSLWIHKGQDGLLSELRQAKATGLRRRTHAARNQDQGREAFQKRQNRLLSKQMNRRLTQFKVGAILTALTSVARTKQHASTIHFDSSRLCEKFRTPKHVVGGQEGRTGILVTSFRSNAERGFFLPFNSAWSTANAAARHRKHGHCDLITGWLKNGVKLLLLNFCACCDAPRLRGNGFGWLPVFPKRPKAPNHAYSGNVQAQHPCSVGLLLQPTQPFKQ